MAALPGTVYLVGAGPGDPDLMTIKSVRLLATADAIVHDRLIPAGALDAASRDAELHDVGKLPGGRPAAAQEQINDLLVELAQANKSVVRLKGGDPFVFGRGGEEALALAAAGVPFEVVPGVTSGVAACAYAGIPVTHRAVAGGVALITGHRAEDTAGTDWKALAAFPGTLVFYMSVASLSEITSRLHAAGRESSEPAAVISRGTLPGQRAVAGTLADIASVAAEAEIAAPAITIVGDVAALRDRIDWFRADVTS
jgi:uroporphyrinogen III methyltransferase/synthase